MAIAFGIPDISDPVVDRSTGFMNEAWYRFFEEWERQTHTSVTDFSSLEAEIATLEGQLANLSTFGFAWDRPVVSFPSLGGVIRHCDAGIAWTVLYAPTNGGHRAWIDGTAPAADVTFTVKVAGVDSGTFTFAAGQLEATYNIYKDTPVGNDDTVTIEAPANLHGITGTIYGTLLGARA